MANKMELKESTVLHKPELHSWKKSDLNFYMDSEAPNWISLDTEGSQILDWVNGKNTFGDLIKQYAQKNNMDLSKAWLHTYSFVQDAMNRNIVTTSKTKQEHYQGRGNYLETKSLKEFWIHLTQTCNLTCTHCLVSSSPQGEKGPGLDYYTRVINETCDLGVERFYFTGGEPFVRPDIYDLIKLITMDKKRELIILTNATLFEGQRLERLKEFDRSRLKFQVSLDGTTARTNDAIRGQGVFEKASNGLNAISALGFETSLTAAVTKDNIQELKDLPSLAKKLGAKSIHLMWLHKRGRILEDTQNNQFPSNSELLEITRKVKKSADSLGILFDNIESMKLRINGQSNVKYDLGNLCWETLCLYIDGNIYPSAAMAGHPALSLGHLNGTSVKALWLGSKLASEIRSSSVIQKKVASQHPFKYLTGGGDIEHSYFFSTNGTEGNFKAEDPYYDLYVEIMKDVMEDIALTKKNTVNPKSGFTPPVIVHAMGEDAIGCSEDAQGWLSPEGVPHVRLLHSNCVLSFDVEKPYKAIQKFYGKAAEKPQEELCCPVKYDNSDISHIPKEVIDRFYGCGSPIASAVVSPGETVLDLGSGAGIDCFIAAKKVGKDGKVIGVDMTDQMLEVARRSKEVVAKNLGFDVVDFRRGYLEKVPADDRSVDLVTSNCVINLSPNKRKVFSEVWRILKDTGRIVVADIVSDQPVPLSLQAHQDLWGECISGSLSEDEFMQHLEKEGFYGLSLLKKTFWKEVEGTKFYSITVRGFKFEKKAGCDYTGQKAIYLGPYKSVVDEEGHFFPRGESVEVCTDTAVKLKSKPYRDHFALLEPKRKVAISISAPAEEAVESCGPAGCC